MVRKVRFKKIETTISEDYFVSRIEGLVGDVKNVVLSGTFDDIMVYELEDTMFVLLSFTDRTGTISVVITGNRDNDFRNFVEGIKLHHNYKIGGICSLVNSEKDFTLPFMDKVKDDKVFFINAIQDLSEYQLFGIDITKLYRFYNDDLDKSYDLVSRNTDYLKDAPIEDVKEILFSGYKDIIILLNDGSILLNGKKTLSNIRTLCFMDAGTIFAVTNDNAIIPVVGDGNSVAFMNDSDYKYKKIIITPIMIVALTFDKNIRLFGTLLDASIDYTRFSNIDDIGYNEDTDDVIVVKSNQCYSLLLKQEYSNLDSNYLIDLPLIKII